jgi:hypothetical protein
LKAIADAVLHRLARRDDVPVHTGILAPAERRVGGELRNGIADDQTRFAAPGDEYRQFPRDAAARDRGVDHGGEAPGPLMDSVLDQSA